MLHTMSMTQEEINVDLFDQVKKLQAELSAAKREALELVTSIQCKEFPELTTWQPLDDVAGIISQIDNMYAGVREQRDKARMQVNEYKEALQSAESTCATMAQRIEREAEDYAVCYGALKAELEELIEVQKRYASAAMIQEDNLSSLSLQCSAARVTLTWYAKQVASFKTAKQHGQSFYALSDDGGKRARLALELLASKADNNKQEFVESLMRCRNCTNWEKRENSGMSDGYCVTFDKFTDPDHGNKCTSFQ